MFNYLLSSLTASDAGSEVAVGLRLPAVHGVFGSYLRALDGGKMDRRDRTGAPPDGQAATGTQSHAGLFVDPMFVEFGLSSDIR